LCNAGSTPTLLRWLRAIHTRPAIRRTFTCSRMCFAKRAQQVRRLLDLAD